MGVVAYPSCLPTAAGIRCFQCDSTSERTCAEALPQHHVLFADSCDNIQEAQFCVKMTGLFEASGLNCYQCDSSRDPHCPEYLRANYHSRPASLTPTSCHGVFEARYCVKTTGMFEGGLSCFALSCTLHLPFLPAAFSLCHLQ
nr:uncharacterized protein LOC128705310 isoform X2 [Cherax quadricarinatus]